MYQQDEEEDNDNEFDSFLERKESENKQRTSPVKQKEDTV